MMIRPEQTLPDAKESNDNDDALAAIFVSFSDFSPATTVKTKW